MSLKHAILGFLGYTSLSGYDLKKAFNGSVQHFWPADQSQIYRTLAQLTAEGLAERAADGQGPRDRHVYAITDAGRAELRRWLATPLPPQDDRNPFLIQVFFAANLSADEALAVIEQHRTQIRAQAALFAALYEHALAQRPSAPSPEAYFFSLLTLEYVLSLAPGYLRWLDSAVARIRRDDYTPSELQQLLAHSPAGEWPAAGVDVVA